MMSQKRSYDDEFKVEAVKLAGEIGGARASVELGVPVDTLYGWMRKAKSGDIDIGCGKRTAKESMSIVDENQMLKKQIKAYEKENRRLKETNEFLQDAAAFFAASRQRYAKNKD